MKTRAFRSHSFNAFDVLDLRLIPSREKTHQLLPCNGGVHPTVRDPTSEGPALRRAMAGDRLGGAEEGSIEIP